MWCENARKPFTNRAPLKRETMLAPCEKSPAEKDRMLDPTYIDPRERYSLRADRALEEDRIRWGRPF
jgi:hypothetical protein